jgi:hypothetical protein
MRRASRRRLVHIDLELRFAAPANTGLPLRLGLRRDVVLGRISVSEAMATSTRADVIRRFYATLPQVRAWIDQLLATQVPSMHEVGLDVEPAVDSARTVLSKVRATSCAASHGCSSLMTSCRGVCKNHCGGRCRDDAASESAVASRATTDPIRRGLAKCALLTRSEKPRNPCRLQLALFRH